MKLSELGEFGLISKIKSLFEDIDTQGSKGIGDDCAVIPCGSGNSLVITTDMLTEDIHFLRGKISSYELGYKSLAVNLSDVAAMGAVPTASFLSISLPKDTEYEWVVEFLRGYKDISAQFGVALLGGDTTSSAGGITINVTALGSVKPLNIKRRCAAQKDDKIFITRSLGDSSQGLIDIMTGKSDSVFAYAHNNPKPYVREGIWLGEQKAVHAMIDISDGLASDLVHILEASGKSAEVDINMIPTNVDINLAVTGGEDYVLLFTADCDWASDLAERYFEEFGSPIYEIGKINDGKPEIKWLQHSHEIIPEWRGFTHF